MKDYNNVKDNPDIEMGTTFNIGNYVCEVDDYNQDNPSESIVFIYKSQKDFENGNYLETVSLLNKDIKMNIEEYMRDTYRVGIEVTRLSLLGELRELINSNLLTYSKDYLMSEPKDDYEVEWNFELQKSKLVDEMIKEEKEKNKDNKNKERDER